MLFNIVEDRGQEKGIIAELFVKAEFQASLQSEKRSFGGASYPKGPSYEPNGNRPFAEGGLVTYGG